MNEGESRALLVVRAIGQYITAWMLVIGILIFLDRLLTGLQDPDLAAIDAATLGIVVGGFVSILAALVNSIFQGEATRSASRQSAQATQAGVQAAMTPVPGQTTTVSAGPPVTVTTTPTPPDGVPEDDLP